MEKIATHPYLRKNIRLYGWFKIFNKRVFLPVTAIYLVSVGKLTLFQIGIVGTVTGIVTLIAQVPTGHFADHYTRRSSMMIGAALLAVSSAALVGFPSFIGALAAGVMSGTGYSFISGAGQSLMHDCLERWGDVTQYVKVMGRAQSRGLIGNTILVGLVPMTYVIKPQMPFILGVIAFIVLFLISWSFIEPKIDKEVEHETTSYTKQIITGVRSFVNRNTVWLFITLGFLSGLYSAPTDYTNLILKDLGTAPQYIGWIFSASSFVGAIGGYALHYLQRFSFKSFLYIDTAVCCLLFIVIGVTHDLWIAIVVTLLNLSFWRLRSILIQHHLLENFKGTSRKTVLMSLLGFGEQLFVILLPVSMAAIITRLGYYTGYTVIGIITIVVLCGITVIGITGLERYQIAKQ